jgi:hypothetical protein
VQFSDGKPHTRSCLRQRSRKSGYAPVRMTTVSASANARVLVGMTNLKVRNQSTLCHPDRSGGICSSLNQHLLRTEAPPYPLSSRPKWRDLQFSQSASASNRSAALPFVIPTEVEGSAVLSISICFEPKRRPTLCHPDRSGGNLQFSGKQGEGLGIDPKMSERRRRATSLRPFPNTPRVTSETVPPAQNSVPAPLSDPGADITLLKDDFGRQRILASPLSGRQVPVVSAYMRAKDSFTAVRCPTRSLSQISQPQTSRRGGIFYASPPRFAAHKQLRNWCRPKR